MKRTSVTFPSQGCHHHSYRLAKLLLRIFLGTEKTWAEQHGTSRLQHHFSSDAKFSISKTVEQVLMFTFVVYEHFIFCHQISHITEALTQRDALYKVLFDLLELQKKN